MIEHSWSDLKAEALEAYQFRLAADPRATWRIEPHKIDPTEFAGIVQYYSYEQEKLKCCVCNRPIHNAGAVIQVVDHTFRLVGRYCGKKHFKSDWTRQESAFNQAEKVALRRKRAKSLLAKSDEIRAFLYELRQPIQKLEQARRSLKDAFGDDFQKICKDLSEHHGILTYTRKSSSAFRSQGGKSSMTSVREEIGWLDGWSVYSILDFRKRLENAIFAMQSALGLMRKSIDSDSDPSKGLKLFSEAKTLIIDILNLYSLSKNYRSHKNFDLLNEWMRHNGSLRKITSILEDKLSIIMQNHPKKIVDLLDLSDLVDPDDLFDEAPPSPNPLP